MRYFYATLAFLLGVVQCSLLFAQDMLYPYWDMQELSPSYTPTSSCMITNLVQGNNYGNTVFLSEASASIGYTGASGNLNASLAARTGMLQKDAMGSAYIEFSVVPSQGYRFIVKAISFGVRSTQTGPQQWALFQQDDQFTTSLAQGPIMNNSTWLLMTIDGVNYSASKSISFRIYGFDGVGSPAINVANWRLDDLKVHLQVIPDNLPVKWLYQRVLTSNAKVVVEWGTEEELEADYFIIQRSFDAIHFDNVAKVPAQSRQEPRPMKRFYQYEDSHPLSGRSFYRILQKDIDGTVEFGKVLTLEKSEFTMHSAEARLVYFSPKGAIKLAGVQNGPITIQLYTMKGQLVFNYHSMAVDGFLQLPQYQLARGYYVVVFMPVKVDVYASPISSLIYIN